MPKKGVLNHFPNESSTFSSSTPSRMNGVGHQSYISAPQRPTLYIAPFSSSILVLHPTIIVLLTFFSQFQLGISFVEYEKGVIYRVGRCDAEMYSTNAIIFKPALPKIPEKLESLIPGPASSHHMQLHCKLVKVTQFIWEKIVTITDCSYIRLYCFGAYPITCITKMEFKYDYCPKAKSNALRWSDKQFNFILKVE